MPITTPPSALAVRAAETLDHAYRTRTPCPPVRGLFDPGDVEIAYQAQRINIDRALATGHRLVGRKIGLTSASVQAQLGVAQPDFGALLSDMQIPDGGEVPTGRLMQPRIEAEAALVLADGLPHPGCTPDEVLQAVAYVLPALEIVDSRIAGWDINIADTIADNASSGLFVLGDTPVEPHGVDLAEVRMTLRRNGETVSTGTGADCLGSPLNAAAWLARALADAGDPLVAGDIVLTGALGPMAPVDPGDTFQSDITGLGSVGVRFAASGQGTTT